MKPYGRNEYYNALFKNMATSLTLIWEIDLRSNSVDVIYDRHYSSSNGARFGYMEFMKHIMEMFVQYEHQPTMYRYLSYDALSNLKEEVSFEIPLTLTSNFTHNFKITLTPELAEDGSPEIIYFSAMDLESVKSSINDVIDRENAQLKRQRNDEIIDLFAKLTYDYHSIYLLNLTDETVTNRKFRGDIYLNDSYYPFEAFYNTFTEYVGHWVHPDHKDLMLEYAHLNTIRKNIAEQDSFTYDYLTCLPDGSTEKRRIYYTKMNDGKIMIAFKSAS